MQRGGQRAGWGWGALGLPRAEGEMVSCWLPSSWEMPALWRDRDQRGLFVAGTQGTGSKALMPGALGQASSPLRAASVPSLGGGVCPWRRARALVPLWGPRVARASRSPCGSQREGGVGWGGAAGTAGPESVPVLTSQSSCGRAGPPRSHSRTWGQPPPLGPRGTVPLCLSQCPLLRRPGRPGQNPPQRPRFNVALPMTTGRTHRHSCNLGPGQGCGGRGPAWPPGSLPTPARPSRGR